MLRLILFTSLVLLAFAGNSVFCRLALHTTSLDPAAFTSIRLIAGATMLFLMARLVKGSHPTGSWRGATALFVYAAALSFAYIGLDTGAGALLLFGAVQITMIGSGLWRGERLSAWQTLGMVVAILGLVILLLPGAHAPDPLSAALMFVSGAAWGVYSLLGRSGGDPGLATAGNFLRTVPMALALSLLMLPSLHWDAKGALYAVLSGALTSGLGYSLWYWVLPQITATRAASLQLSVPVIATVGGALFVLEPVTLRQVLASITILGGIALVIHRRKR